MLDLIIAGGRIVDGTGAEAKSGDIGVKDGRIVELGGRITSQSARRIDADGAIVTPGFVDIHTHYDGQACWDDSMDPSFSCGVTTTILGNCGVGFAPVRNGDEDRMIAVMEGVEAIPGIVLKEGVPFAWESFPEYLDFLEKRQYTMDLGVLLAHAPLRVYAMGERAVTHQAATADDLAIMTKAMREAMKAGAFGFSSGRVEEHFYGDDFAKVPGTYAEKDELEAIARVMGEGGTGQLQIVSRGAAGAGLGPYCGPEVRLNEHRLFESLARVSGRPVHYILTQYDADPDDWRTMTEETAKARAQGLDIYAHVGVRGFGFLVYLDGYHNFMLRPAYREIAHLPAPQRAAAMRDPARRAAILSGEDVPMGGDVRMLDWGMVQVINMRSPLFFLLDPENPDYEPTPDKSFGAIAERTGRTAAEVVYDSISAGDGGNIVMNMMLNYSNGDLNHVESLLANPHTISSLGDGGAHVKLVSDAALAPFHLTFWARDRKRGKKFSIESMVERVTSRTARAYGFTDRGELTLGKRADINVIDFDRLQLDHPTVRRDFPANGMRLHQGARGFLATIQNGQITRENDIDTGRRPGRLVRANAIK